MLDRTRLVVGCLLAVLLIVGFAESAAVAATYYVDVSNAAASDDNPGTEELPWLTIDNGDVKGLLVPGDTVIVKPGTYGTVKDNPAWGGWKNVAFATVSGEEGNPITYQAAGPGVILDGSAGDAPDAALGVWMVGAGPIIHDVVIDGFQFTKGCNGVLINNSQRITVKNCEFYELGTSPLCGAIYDCGGTSNVYTDNKIHHLRAAAFGGWNCGWWFQFATDTVVARNIMTDTLAPTSAFAFLVNAGSGVKFINNTAPGPAVNFIRCWSAPQNAVVANNIVGKCDQALYNQDSATLTSSYNMFYGCSVVYGSGLVSGPGDFVGFDPGFVGSGDYHLAPTSTLINAAKDMGLPFNGPAPDFGCFETDSTTAASVVTGSVTMGPAPVPGVAIAISSGESTSTAEDGSYRIPLAPGTYTVSATLGTMEFSPVNPSVVINAGETTIQDFTAPFDPKVYHVDINSSAANDYGPGTEAEPWQHIDAGELLGLLKPGDTVLVHPGTYTAYEGFESSFIVAGVITNCSGLRGLPITYQATAPGVILDGGVEAGVDPNAFVCGFYSRGTHDIVIDGFEFTRAVFGSCADSTQRYTIKNCSFHDMAGTALWMGNSSFAIYDNVGADSVYTDNVFYSTMAPGHAGGLWLANGRGHLVARNLQYGISGATAEILVPANCANVRLVNNTQDGGTNLLRAWNGCKNIAVTNNIVVNVSEMAIRNEDAPGAVVNSYNLFYNCAANWGVNATEGPGEFTADPAFVGGSPFDYHLTSGSPAVDAGIDVGFAFNSFAPDLGAYESTYESYVDVANLLELKNVPLGRGVKMTDTAIATSAVPGAAFEGFYLEHADRLTGVKILPAPGFTLPTIAEGDRISVNGRLDKDANNELCIYASAVTSQGAGTALGALGMTNKSLPTGDKGAFGLLVTIWGNVTGTATDAIYVDDGSGVDDGLGIAKGIRVVLNGLPAPTSGTVAVTGEAGLLFEGGKTITVIRPRVAADIR